MSPTTRISASRSAAVSGHPILDLPGGPKAEVQRFLQLQHKVIADLKSGRLPPSQLEAVAAKFPMLDDEASKLLWSDPAARHSNLQFGAELSRLAPNAVIRRQNGYPVTAREMHATAMIQDAQVSHNGAAVASRAADFVRQFPRSPMAGWAKNLAGSDF